MPNLDGALTAAEQKKKEKRLAYKKKKKEKKAEEHEKNRIEEEEKAAKEKSLQEKREQVTKDVAAYRAKQAEEVAAKKLVKEEEEKQQQAEKDKHWEELVARNKEGHAKLDETFARVSARLQDIGDAYQEEIKLPETLKGVVKELFLKEKTDTQRVNEALGRLTEFRAEQREEKQADNLNIIKALTKLSETLQERGSVELINGIPVLDIIDSINNAIDEVSFASIDNTEIITLLQVLREVEGIGSIVDNALAAFGVEEDIDAETALQIGEVLFNGEGSDIFNVRDYIADFLEGQDRQLRSAEIERMINDVFQEDLRLEEVAAEFASSIVEGLTSEIGALVVRQGPITLEEHIASGGRVTFVDGFTLPRHVEPAMDLTLAPGGGVLTVYIPQNIEFPSQLDEPDYVITDIEDPLASMQENAEAQLNQQASGGGWGIIGSLLGWGGGAS